MKNKEYLYFAQMVFQPFIDEFSEKYNDCVFKDKAEILNYVDDIFFKWYNSPYFSGTILTPYKLLERKLFNMMGKMPENRFLVKQQLNKNNCSFKIQEHKLSIYKHNIIADLKAFVKNGELYSVNGFEEMKKARKSFSIFSPDYMEYLYQLSIRLFFFDKLESIYVEKEIYVPNDYIFNYDPDELIHNIIEEAIDMSCEKLNSLLYAVDKKLKERFSSANDYMIVFEKAFDDSILREIIGGGAMVRDIQISILDVFEIDMSQILEKSLFDLTDNQKFYLKLYNWLGKEVEKNFVIPFSQYLNVFAPFYRNCFDIDVAIKEFFYNRHFEEESCLEVATSERFQLTAFGKEFFCSNIEDEFDEKFEIFEPDAIMFFLQEDYEKSKFINLMDNKILKLKIEKNDDKDNSLVIEITDNNKLSYLYKEICLRFFEPIDSSYSFFKGDTISPFLEFPSCKKNKNTVINKLAENCGVKNIFDEENKKAVLVIDADKQNYSIECLDISMPEYKTYPYLDKIGKNYLK